MLLDPLDLPRLRAALPIAHLGDPLYYASSIPSTNARALELSGAGARVGTVLRTDEQPAGRGRQCLAWVTLQNAQILLSLIVDLPAEPHWLVLATSVALSESLEHCGVPSQRLSLKWPNDLLLDGRKIAGILIETTTAPSGQRLAVIGMGVNVRGTLTPWPAIASRASTIADRLARDLDREAIILEFLRSLSQLLATIAAEDAQGLRALWAIWRSRLGMLGQPVTIQQSDHHLQGIAEDVSEEGALLLRLPDGSLRPIYWGDVETIGN